MILARDRLMATGKLRPLARALRGPALLRRTYVVLGREVEEAIFRRAEVLSEGGCRVGPAGRDAYFGSTMISVDLDHLRSHWRGEFDTKARAALAAAVDGSARVRLRAMRLARAEAARRVPGRAFGTAQVEIRVRLNRDQLHIDVDLEVPLGLSSGSGEP